MNFLKAIILFILVETIPLLVVYLAFEGPLRAIVLSFVFIAFLVVFLFAEKFVLFFLNAREVVDRDFSVFFRVAKSSAFNNFESMPNIYLYSGSLHKAFAFDSGTSWSIVIDRELLASSSKDELAALVEFFIGTKKSGRLWLQTKCMGFVGIILKSNFWLTSFLFKWQGSTKFARTMTFISLMFLKPLVEMIQWLNISRFSLECRSELKPIYYRAIHEDIVKDFNQFLGYQLDEKSNQAELIKKYLESFPIFEHCKFTEETLA